LEPLLGSKDSKENSKPIYKKLEHPNRFRYFFRKNFFMKLRKSISKPNIRGKRTYEKMKKNKTNIPRNTIFSRFIKKIKYQYQNFQALLFNIKNKIIVKKHLLKKRYNLGFSNKNMKESNNIRKQNYFK